MPSGRLAAALEVLVVATRLGLMSFGGPVAHLGYFRSEYVVQRRWLDEQTYAEYEADKGGAAISGHPLWLAAALEKLETARQQVDNVDAERNPATAHLFIVNPLHGDGLSGLFATHPSTEERIARLRAMAGQNRGQSPAEQRGPWG